MARSINDKQITNRNYLAPTGFNFTLQRCPKVSFFSNTAQIPGIDLGVAIQPSYLKEIPRPGDQLQFQDYILRFLVDENLTNYMQIQNWMRGLGFPESLREIYNWQKNRESFEQPTKSDMNLYSDGTLIALTSNNVFNFQVKFRSMFPYSLSVLEFDATRPETEYFTAEVSFKYMIYDILDKKGNPLNPTT